MPLNRPRDPIKCQAKVRKHVTNYADLAVVLSAHCDIREPPSPPGVTFDVPGGVVLSGGGYRSTYVCGM